MIYKDIEVIKTGYYSADSIEGVRYHGESLLDDVNLLDPSTFYSCLKTLKEKVIIFCYLDRYADRDIINLILTEYGIHI